MSGLGKVDLLKLEQVAGRVLNLPGRVLGLALQVDLWRVLNDPLDIHLDELVKGVQLLPHQSFNRPILFFQRNEQD